ncbi:peptide/nickel transport system ATP-binding protein/oligopeptide transport system ATP-binding protein [Rhodococcus sp. AG1013]|uniref:ABC transporter ATP-binding protein n=1 Tax=Rhodococcus sp. AG1013 TaxID=2183996 RepID=UPI000E0BA976|nr:ATP-binding cassette domain-containing protein [Rhodococcus sp. AG1013]RDI16476.1 peptide/nickel transport system ATP-binding protein/oligopeptide transport system ATP-binding protein [Rhodococcus sp. AG1013]
MSPLLEVSDLVKTYPVKRNLLGRVRERTTVTDHVSFTVERGETVGIVGESGAGKSTVGRLALRLIEPDSGSIVFDGRDVRGLSRAELREFRQRAQMIFQDPFSSLDPHMTIREAVGEPLTIHRGLKGIERDAAVTALLARVGLRADQLDKYPREFSGGQLQRIAIARALTTEPDFIVCDEPVAALDVSIQAQVLNLLIDLQRERGLAYVFVSHDLSLVRFLAHRVAVMRKGVIVEMGPTEQVFTDPQHAYTKTLLEAIPDPRAHFLGRRAEADAGRAASAMVGTGKES